MEKDAYAVLEWIFTGGEKETDAHPLATMLQEISMGLLPLLDRYWGGGSWGADGLGAKC